mgnify:CR=1 FL=1
MKSFTIAKNDAGQRLDKFITKAVPLLPQGLMYKYIRTKRIKVNSKRSEISYKLVEGDTVDMYINDEFFAPAKEHFDFLSASKKLDIIYEDENILLLNKKVGLLSHPDDTEYNDTLITRVKRYLHEKGEYDPRDEQSFTPSLVNRIDRNTGGIVIAAKNAETLRVMNQKIRDREVEKSYLCIILGAITPPAGRLEGYLLKDEAKKLVSVHKTPVPGGRTAVTLYQTLAQKNGLSLVACRLVTGRTHQIRAQFAAAGHPLLGDGKYGRARENKKYGRTGGQALCSYQLAFRFTTDAGCLAGLNGRVWTVDQVDFVTDYFPHVPLHP